MRRWLSLGIGVGIGLALTLLFVRLSAPATANAQYLSKFQNVQFQFSTTGTTSTLAFFNRETGEVFLYVASGRGDFQFVKRLAVKELGSPLTAGAVGTRIPRLPTGVETEP
jgi:hypothetical protein